MIQETKKPEAVISLSDKQELRIKDLIKKLNESTVKVPDAIDLECQRELEDKLIEIVNDRYNGVSRDEYLDAEAVENILEQISLPSEYLKSEFQLQLDYLIIASAKSLSDSAALPLSASGLDLE